MRKDNMPSKNQAPRSTLMTQPQDMSTQLLREIEEHRAFLQQRLKSLEQMQLSLETARTATATAAAEVTPCDLVLREDGLIAEMSPACADLLTQAEDSLQGQRFSKFVTPDERERWSHLFKQALADKQPHLSELQLQLHDGALIDSSLECQAFAAKGESARLHVSLSDISELNWIKKTLGQFRSAEELSARIDGTDWLYGVVDQSLAGIYLIQDDQFAYANQGFADIFGFDSVAEITHKLGVGDLVAPHDRARVAENVRRRAEGDVPEMRYSFVGIRKDGREIDVEVHGRRMLFHGKAAVIGVILDITERKLAEQQLRIAAIAFESQDSMLIIDTDRVILRANKAFAAMTGYSQDELIGMRPSQLRSDRHNDAFYKAIWHSVLQTGSWQGELWSQRKNGEAFPGWQSVTSVVDAQNKATNYVITLTDITARKAAESEIEYLAFYDQLTRLPNRRLLLDRLQHALTASKRSGTEGALLFIDLDNFKDTNDTLGHEKGDLLLQQVASRLGKCVRDCDTVARLGGDEFVVMLEGLSSNADEAAAQSMMIGEKVLATLNLPYPLAELQHHSTPSIGITLFNAQKNNCEELLIRADLAMYKAKEAGRNTLRFFDPGMQAAVTARTVIETDLRIGLRRGEFLVYYQPQIGADGRITGAEALVRWKHPSRGMVSPAEFIPIAEASGLILPLGQWVLETACRQLVTWSQNPAMAHLTLAVNVSARQFHHPDFVSLVLETLTSIGINPSRLKLELTESLLLDDIDDVIVKMTALKNRGIGFSLDDFGTGYSSLAYLKRLPLDQLKIDQSFVNDVLTDGNDAAITSAIVALAHSLGLSVIAEGVETEAQRKMLADQGCHAYQGYLFGRPDVVSALERLLLQENIGL
jgi:diguanylate cyclase (GGDEF)-like protein/PAS domain S-box-containing protein